MLLPSAASAARYVALGDSYSSGLGTGNYYTGSCARSPLAYPPLVEQRLDQVARRDVRLAFAACSGATTADVLDRQIGAVNRKTRWVTISIGANDIGFIGGYYDCSSPPPARCGAELDRERQLIQGPLAAELSAVYAAIRRRARKARVVAVGYPRLLSGAECAQAASIDPAEQAELNGVVDLLASVQAREAKRFGFRFVDPREAFAGHAICAPVEWINGRVDPRGESYHPSAAGQQGYAGLVARKLL
jgi:lysophospholipase L1-like esterase